MSTPDSELYSVGLAAVPAAQMLVTPPGQTQVALGTALQGLNQGTVVENSVASISAAGTTLGTATTVTTQTCVITTAALNTGVALPLSSNCLGMNILVINNGSNPVKVYGSGGDTIDGTAGATGVTLTNGHRSFFTSPAAGSFVSGPSGLVSS